MEIKILNERENPLLKRKEIRFRIRFGAGTPTFKDVRSEAISQLKLNEKLMVMNGLKTEFGSKHADCYAKVYSDEKSMKIEPVFRIKKNFEGKKKKEAAEKPEAKNPVGHPKDGEEKPAEKPKAEEKKVEKPKAEEKPAGHPHGDEKQEAVAENPKAIPRGDGKPEKSKEEKPVEKPKAEQKAEKPKEEVKEKK